MGQAASRATSAAATILNNEGEEPKAKELMELMMKLADARLDSFENKMNEMFLSQASSQRTSALGRRAVRFERRILFDAETVPGQGVEGGVDDFFATSKSNDDEVLAGLKLTVKNGLTHILGDTSAGESYGQRFFIGVKHNAIIRVDMCTYKYNFSNEGVVSNFKNMFAYILCVSVVDHRDISADELIYLASELAEKDEMEPNSVYDPYLANLTKTWSVLNDSEGDPRRRPVGNPFIVPLREQDMI